MLDILSYHVPQLPIIRIYTYKRANALRSAELLGNNAGNTNSISRWLGVLHMFIYPSSLQHVYLTDAG